MKNKVYFRKLPLAAVFAAVWWNRQGYGPEEY